MSAFDGETRIAAHSTTAYVAVEHAEPPDSRPAYQAARASHCPWPFVRDWTIELAQNSGTNYQITKGEISARSDDLGLSLTWDESKRLTRLEWKLPDSPDRWHIVQYSGFRASGHWWAPALFSDDHGRGVISSRLVDVQVDPPDAESLFRGDDIKKVLDRFDPVTSNLVNPDGSVRYNERELFGAMAAKERGGMWWRWPLRGAIALGVLASLYHGWKRWRTA